LRANNAWIYAILNFPIRIIESIFLFIKKIARFIWPVLRVAVGISLAIGMCAALIGLSFAAGMLLFDINSPYLISDIPLHEFTNSVHYYVLIVALYVVGSIPLLFILLLGVSMLGRKNLVRPIVSGFFVGIWMLAVVAAGVTALGLAPQIKSQVDAVRQENIVTQEYDFSEYDKIRIGGHGDMHVTQGDEFKFRITGNQEEINRLYFKQEDGELRIMQRGREDGWCIVCFDKPLTYDIVLPQLSSFIVHGSVDAQLAGFTQNMRINVGEAAHVSSDFSGQRLVTYLAGSSGTLELTSSPRNIEATLEGLSSLEALQLESDMVSLDGYYYSRTNLAGAVVNLKANMKNYSRLSAEELRAQSVVLDLEDYAKADVWPVNSFFVQASDYGRVRYYGQPLKVEDRMDDYASIEREELDWEWYSDVYEVSPESEATTTQQNI